MKYIDGFRNPRAARTLIQRIQTHASRLKETDRRIRVMEVCGTHTMAIARYGIRDVLPDNVNLISGPGCPVCVTSAGYIDAAVELARKGVIIASFGDMLRVPGSEGSLAECRADGGHVEVCFSPVQALDLAQKYDKEVVFLGVGFETTIGPVMGLVHRAIEANAEKVSVLTAFKCVPPALTALITDPEIAIDAFLCPAHVSAIIGSDAYIPYAETYQVPCVVAGFEPLDILLGIDGILQQLCSGTIGVDNQYSRVVKPKGNQQAMALMDRFLEPCDVPWRGIGVIPHSGLRLRQTYSQFDATIRHNITVKEGAPDPACRCGDILKGIITPPECGLFGTGCLPQTPVGPCMVSSEGTCAAYYKYGQRGNHSE